MTSAGWLELLVLIVAIAVTTPLRFGPNVVATCDRCHRLRVEPIVDPRVPSFAEHVQALREEIGVQEEEGGPRLVDPAVGADDRLGAEERLQLLRLEPLIQDVGDAAGGELHEGLEIVG